MEKIKINKETTEKELKKITEKIFNYIALNGGCGLYVHAYLNRHHYGKSYYYYRSLYLKNEKSFHNIYEDNFLRTKINKDYFYETLIRTHARMNNHDEVTIIY